MLRVHGLTIQTGWAKLAVLLRLSETRHITRDTTMRKVPVPFDPTEFISTKEARRRDGVAQRTMREWCVHHRIGRRIAGRWRVSQVALDMLLGKIARLWRPIT